MSKDWQDWLRAIEKEFENNQNNFLKQPNIARTVHPKHGGMNLYVKMLQDSYGYLVLSKNGDPDFGGPTREFSNHSLIAVQSAYYVYLMNKYLTVTPRDLEEVHDIGGGYGFMAYTFFKNGFQGKYTIADFEIMNKMQKHFLDNVCPTNDYKCILLKEENIQPVKDNSLLIGTFSINEMPLDSRAIIEKVYAKHKYIFIAHKKNKAFNNVDNTKYFNELASTLANTHKVHRFNCPMRSNDFYLIGEQK